MEVAKYKDTAELFFEIRKQNNLSKTGLAERINSNVPYLSNIEKGKRIAGKNILERLAEEFKIDLEACLALRSPNEPKKNKKLKKKVIKGKKENVIDLEERKTSRNEKKEIVLDNFKTPAALFLGVRKANNLTLSKMRDELVSSTSHLSQIERGIKLPGKRMVTKLADRFDLPLNKCLKIAGLKVVEEKKETLSKTPLLTSTNLPTEVINVKDDVVPTRLEKKEEIKTNVSEKETKPAEGVPLLTQVERKTDFVALETMEYTVLARGEYNLNDKQAYISDLRPIMDNMIDNSYVYEFAFILDSETNKTVQIKLSKGLMKVEIKK
ncbi:helix-turn-helix transcriptional regulator [Priestia aryabhattai]